MWNSSKGTEEHETSWLQEAEDQQIHNQAFAFDMTELLPCAPLCGLGQAAAPCTAPGTSLCQKHSTHCCSASSANTAEDPVTFARVSSHFPKRRTHLPWCTFSHWHSQLLLIPLPYTKIDVMFLGVPCIFLDSDSLQLYRDTHFFPTESEHNTHII